MVVEPSPHSGFKHARTSFGASPHTKRPINKSLVAVLQSTNDATDTVTTLFTTTFPCTITGLRWDLTITQDAGTSTCFAYWVIAIVRQGMTIPTIATTDGATFFAPESDCLVFGTTTIENNIQSKDFIGSTKTMRKMQGGDTLIFIGKGAATNTHRVDGVVQFFCKT